MLTVSRGGPPSEPRGEAKPKAWSNCFEFTLVVQARSPSFGSHSHETSMLPDTAESVSLVSLTHVPGMYHMYECTTVCVCCCQACQ